MGAAAAVNLRSEFGALWVETKALECVRPATTCTLCACRYLALGPGTQLADLMGTKGPKKGGMKGTKSKSGPIKELSGLHTDGRPMRLSVQVRTICL